MKRSRIAKELAALHRKHGSLDPASVVDWARTHPASALHARFDWNDTTAAHKYRLWQARDLITEVEVEYPDGKLRQVYVSPLETRGNGGYLRLADVLSDSELKRSFLEQALAEYERVGERYADLAELAGVRSEVRRVRAARSRSSRRVA